jgi:hypothetical protein
MPRSILGHKTHARAYRMPFVLKKRFGRVFAVHRSEDLGAHFQMRRDDSSRVGLIVILSQQDN